MWRRPASSAAAAGRKAAHKHSPPLRRRCSRPLVQGVELGAAAGLERRSLLSGAADVFRMFAANESSAYGRAAVVKAGQPDHLLSTHPAAVNRLARLSGVPGQ